LKPRSKFILKNRIFFLYSKLNVPKLKFNTPLTRISPIVSEKITWYGRQIVAVYGKYFQVWKTLQMISINDANIVIGQM